MRAGRYAAAAAAVMVPAAGCGRTQSSVAPQSRQARDIASLFWWMMGGAWIGLAVVVGLLVFAWKRRARSGVAGPRRGPHRRRDPQLLGTGAEPKNRRDPRPHERDRA